VGMASLTTIKRVRSSTSRGLMMAGLIWAIGSPAYTSFYLMDMGWSKRIYPYERIFKVCGELRRYLYIYGREHREHEYPPHLAALIVAEPGASVLLDVQARTMSERFKLPSPPPQAWQEIASEVERRSAFIYTAGDLSEARVRPASSMPAPSTTPAAGRYSDLIIAYTRKLVEVPDHRIILFTSGSPRLVPEAEMPKYIEACNAARARYQLPPIALDTPVAPRQASSPATR